jgi:hypothetical protein
VKKLSLIAGLAFVLSLFVLSDGLARRPAAADDGTHDLGVSELSVSGPGAVNLSDTNGRYMWVTAKVTNHSAHDETISVAMTIAEPMPAGCAREARIIVPAQTSMIMYAGETKSMVWRVRYECHSPATNSVVPQTVTVRVTHQPDGIDTQPSNNTASLKRYVMVR